jgi:hypothetical protein
MTLLTGGSQVGCFEASCPNVFHLPCAMAGGCRLRPFNAWCPGHRAAAVGSEGGRGEGGAEGKGEGEEEGEEGWWD